MTLITGGMKFPLKYPVIGSTVNGVKNALGAPLRAAGSAVKGVKSTVNTVGYGLDKAGSAFGMYASVFDKTVFNKNSYIKGASIATLGSGGVCTETGRAILATVLTSPRGSAIATTAYLAGNQYNEFKKAETLGDKATHAALGLTFLAITPFLMPDNRYDYRNRY